MKMILVPGLLMATCALALAKLPPPDDATKAKAAETAAKQAWQGKVDNFLLCKSQDRVAAYYVKTAARPTAKDPKQVAPTPSSPATTGNAPAAAATPAASGTPVAASAPPAACADPGPFAYNAPSQKPLEASGAHSPAGNAASPPSVKPNSAEMAPAVKK